MCLGTWSAYRSGGGPQGFPASKHPGSLQPPSGWKEGLSGVECLSLEQSSGPKYLQAAFCTF